MSMLKTDICMYNNVACIPVARQHLQHTCGQQYGNSVFLLHGQAALCNSRTMMSHNSMWPSRDTFPMRCASTSLTLGLGNSTVHRDVSVLSDLRLHDEGQTEQKQVVEQVVEASKVEPGYRRSLCEDVMCD